MLGSSIFSTAKSKEFFDTMKVSVNVLGFSGRLTVPSVIGTPEAKRWLRKGWSNDDNIYFAQYRSVVIALENGNYDNSTMINM